MTNAEWMMMNHMKFEYVTICNDPNSIPTQTLDMKITCVCGFVKWKNITLVEFTTEYSDENRRVAVLRDGFLAFAKWLDEEHQNILTNNEKRILSDIIKPYRSRVFNISHIEDYIIVHYKTTPEDEPNEGYESDARVYVIQPNVGLQFSGMKQYVSYTLEELGISE